MKEFKSAFKPAIEEYLEFRSAMGYCNEHEQQLRYFDKYCYEYFPEQTELTKEVVRGWFYDEIASGRACLSSKATTIRLFARLLGSSAYVLPMNCVPKTPTIFHTSLQTRNWPLYFKPPIRWNIKTIHSSRKLPLHFYVCCMRVV